MNEIAVTPPTAAPNVATLIMNPTAMAALYQFAVTMSEGVATVPKHLQGKPADCMAITLQAMRWGMDPYVVASKTSVVNGNLTYEAQLVVAVLKSSGAIEGRPHYEWRGEGDALEARSGFIPKGEREIVWTEWIAKKGITVQNSPLWKTNPKQQMGYLQGRNWARLYAPDALLGVYTPDEFFDAGAAEPRVVHMGVATEVAPPASAPTPAPAPAPALPAYSDANVEKNLTSWNQLIQSGKKTADQIVGSLLTKATLTDAQAQRIYDLAKPPEADPQDDELTEHAAEDGAQP